MDEIDALLAKLEEHPQISNVRCSRHWHFEQDWPAIVADIDIAGIKDVWLIVTPDMLKLENADLFIQIMLDAEA